MKPPASLNEFGRILPSLPARICVLDRATRYLAASSRYANLCGVDPDEITGRNMLEVCPPDLVENALRDFQTLDSGKHVVDHHIIFRERIFLVSVAPIYESYSSTVAAISVALTEAGRPYNRTLRPSRQPATRSPFRAWVATRLTHTARFPDPNACRCRTSEFQPGSQCRRHDPIQRQRPRESA